MVCAAVAEVRLAVAVHGVVAVRDAALLADAAAVPDVVAAARLQPVLVQFWALV